MVFIIRAHFKMFQLDREKMDSNFNPTPGSIETEAFETGSE